LHSSVKSTSANTRSRNQTAVRLWFPLQTLQTSHRQLFFRPAPIFDVAPVPHPLSFLAHAVLHAHLVVFPHTCLPTSPLPFALADNDRFSLSDLFSLGSRPDRPAHCRHLTIRTAIRVSPLPCFRPRIDGHRLLCSPLMGSRPRAETPPLAQPQSTISRP
jgi:hypothetical protein